jgi:hypothetical protein
MTIGRTEVIQGSLKSRPFEAGPICFIGRHRISPWINIQALTALNKASAAQISMTQRNPATKDRLMTRFTSSTVAAE